MWFWSAFTCFVEWLEQVRNPSAVFDGYRARAPAKAPEDGRKRPYELNPCYGNPAPNRQRAKPVFGSARSNFFPDPVYQRTNLAPPVRGCEMVPCGIVVCGLPMTPVGMCTWNLVTGWSGSR